MATTGFAERIAYGRPINLEADADEPIHLIPRATTALVGRLLIAAIFIGSGVMKLTDTAGTAAYMTSVGLPQATTLAIIAGIAEVAGGAAIAFGFLGRLAALALIVLLIPTTLLFHNFWALEGAEAQMQMGHFMKNLAIIGGLLLLYAHGPGRYSLDARMRRPLDA